MACNNGWLGNYPNLTAKMIRQNWPNTIETAQGHLTLQRQGLRSTKSRSNKAVHFEPPGDTEINTILEAVLFDRSGNCIFADATGRFPMRADSGEEYILVLTYKNYIKPIPFANRASDSYVKAYRQGIQFFKSLGHDLTSIVIDNETSAPLENLFVEMGLIVQYVAPGDKRSNKAERSIQTFRNHLLSSCGSLHADFPMQKWPKLLPQMEITVNILHPYGDDNKISAYHGIHGSEFDFLAHPIAPLGTLVYVFEPPDKRQTWNTHGEIGYYIGPAMQSYRSYHCIIKSTCADRVSNTIQLFPAPLFLPGSSKHDILLQVLKDTQQLVATEINDDSFAAITTRLDAAIAMFLPVSSQPVTPLSPHPEPVSSQRVAPASALDTDLRQRVPEEILTTSPPAQPVPTAALPSSNPLQQRHKKPVLYPKRPAVSDYRIVTAAEKKEPLYAQLLSNLGRRWTDTDTNEDFIVTNVVLPNMTHGPGSKTPHYEFMSVSNIGSPAIDCVYHHTRCSEIHNAKYVQWRDSVPTRTGQKTTPLSSSTSTPTGRHNTPISSSHPTPTGQNNTPTSRTNPTPTGKVPTLEGRRRTRSSTAAIRSEETYDNRILNMQPDGKKLSLHRELTGKHARYWKLADREEKIRLLDSNTIVGVHRHHIPADTVISYYNAQCKEKLATVDSETFVDYRVRGTFGGDQLHRHDIFADSRIPYSKVPSQRCTIRQVAQESQHQVRHM